MSAASEATPNTRLPTDAPSAVVAETMAEVPQTQEAHSPILSVGSPDLALMFEYPEAPSLALEIPPRYSVFMFDHPQVDPYVTPEVVTQIPTEASSLAPAGFSPTALVEPSVTSYDVAPSTSLGMETPTLASMFMFDLPQMDPSATLEVTSIPTDATSLAPMGISQTPSEAILSMVDHFVTPDAAPIPTEATSFPPEGFSHAPAEAIKSMVEPSVTSVVPLTPVVASQTQLTCSVDVSAENIAAPGEVNYSPPMTQPSIPPGAVIIRHTGNVISHLSKRRRGKIPSNIRIFSRAMFHMSASTQAAPSQMPPWPQPAIPIQQLAPPCPRPNPGPQARGFASTSAKRRGRPPGSGKKQKMQSSANLDG